MPNMNVSISLALALALGIGAGPGLAQNTTRGQTFFEQWDADGDGKVTPAEARTRRADVFEMFDADGDGVFSDAELKSLNDMRNVMRESARPDTPLMQGPGRGQGRVQGMAGAGQPRGMGPGQGQGRGMGPGQGQGRMQAAPQGRGQRGAGRGVFAQDMQMFDRPSVLDGNRDGKLSRDEFLRGTQGFFQRRDRNGDGVITPEDFGR